MAEKIKLRFNHDDPTFGGSVGISEERYNEITRKTWEVLQNSCGDHHMTQILEILQDDLGGELTAAEMFTMGITFGVAEYMQKQNGKDKYSKLKEMVEQAKKGEAIPMLNTEEFVKHMKDGKNDF